MESCRILGLHNRLFHVINYAFRLTISQEYYLSEEETPTAVADPSVPLSLLRKSHPLQRRFIHPHLFGVETAFYPLRGQEASDHFLPDLCSIVSELQSWIALELTHKLLLSILLMLKANSCSREELRRKKGKAVPLEKPYRYGENEEQNISADEVLFKSFPRDRGFTALSMQHHQILSGRIYRKASIGEFTSGSRCNDRLLAFNAWRGSSV
jgi:hypothetical protein